MVDKFTYLGSTLSRVVHIDDEVNARTAKAGAAFGWPRGSIWNQRGIRLDTKLKVYRSVVLPTLLYACKTWTVHSLLGQHAKRLNHFHTSCLRKLLKIKWQNRIPDTEVLKRAGMQSIHTLLKFVQLKWTDRVTRMPDERLPKKILYGELQVGKSFHGSQKKRYKDTLKASIKDFNIPTESFYIVKLGFLCCFLIVAFLGIFTSIFVCSLLSSRKHAYIILTPLNPTFI